jgi:hypothetical protein
MTASDRMKDRNTNNVQWLDFSGAPPMIIPSRLAKLWRGTTDPATDDYRELDLDNPVTDYDRACAVASLGRGILEFEQSHLLVLYSESDSHAWDGARRIVACGGWLPSDEELARAEWANRIEWRCDDNDLLLMNSATDSAQGFLEGDFMSIHLPSGIYHVESSYLALHYVGYFHRFILRKGVA